MLARKRIAVIGAGKLGETLIKALLEAKVVQAEQITATTKHPETSKRKGDLHGIKTSTDNAAAAKNADVIIVSVKPQVMGEALASIKKVVGKNQIVISTAASVSTSFIERGLTSGVPVIRTMPNTACLVRSGMTGICAGKHARREHLALAEGIFAALGRVLVLD